VDIEKCGGRLQLKPPSEEEAEASRHSITTTERRRPNDRLLDEAKALVSRSEDDDELVYIDPSIRGEPSGSWFKVAVSITDSVGTETDRS